MDLVVDRSKLPGDLWVRMVWSPKEASDPAERPVVLVGDRKRWRIGLVPTVLGLLLLIALALVRAPLVLLIVPVGLGLAGARYAAGGPSGYYEVRDDGGLGDFLGRRTPPGLSTMRRTKS